MAKPPFEDWHELRPIREVFLQHVPPEAAAAFRHLGDLIFQAILEFCTRLPPVPHEVSSLRAVAADLRHCAGYLHLAVPEILGGQDPVLAAKARRWGLSVARLAAAIEAEVGPRPATSQGRDQR